MARAHLYVVALGLLAASAPSAAQPAPEPLRILPSCDAGGAEACVDIDAIPFWPEEATIVWGVPAGYDGSVTTSIRGRLEGQPARDRDVLVTVVGGPCGESAFLAYLGRDDDGAPLVLTDAGVLAIEEPGIRLVNAGARVLIDPRSASVLASYAAPFSYNDGEFFFHASAEVYLLHRGLCMTAPSERPGRLAVAPGKCGEDADADRHGHGLDAAAGGDAEIVARAYPHAVEQWGPEFSAVVRRVRGADVIVYNGMEYCT